MKHGAAIGFLLVLLVSLAGARNFFNDLGNEWGQAAETCNPPQRWWKCTQVVYLTASGMLGGMAPPSNCDAASVIVCSGSAAQAAYHAQDEFLPVAAGYTWVENRCEPSASPPSGPNPQPLDYPNCDSIVPADAGPPTTCIPGDDACSVCLDTCCNEFTNCEPATECAQMVDYWMGVGPAAGGQASPDVASLDTCFTNAGCNDVSICGAKAHRPAPGGV